MFVSKSPFIATYYHTDLLPGLIAFNVAITLPTVDIPNRTNGTETTSLLTTIHWPSYRGIPIGFINKLEARLAETEKALFKVLHSQESGPADSSSSLKFSPQRKADRIKEWDALPLSSLQEIRKWYFEKLDDSGSNISKDQPIRETTWHQPERTVPILSPPVPVLEPESSGRDISPIVSAEEDMGDVTWNPNPPEPTGSKAKDLEQRRPQIYF